MNVSRPRADRILLLGSKRLGLRILTLLQEMLGPRVVGAVTIDDRADVRTCYDGWRRHADATGLNLVVAGDNDEATHSVRSFHPDFCLVAGWYWLIRPSLLNLVPRGFHGIHFSLLPRYRGSAPLVWAMIHGERETGVSLFAMTERMDQGPLWGQARVPIGPGDYVGDVLDRLEEEALLLLRRILPGMTDGSLSPAPQEETGASSFGIRRPEDGRIDWREPANRLFDFVRAQAEPYPGAFTEIEGMRIRVWRASPLEGPADRAPGTIVAMGDENVDVACGNGILRLHVASGEEVKRGPAARCFTGLRARRMDGL